MHRIGRAGRYKDTGTSFVVYKNGIDRMITRLGNKNINFHYYLVKNPSEMVEKPLKIHAKKHQMIDEETNKKIQQIIYRSDKKIQPCYKKRLAKKINKVKQKKRHEFIEKRIKRVLISKNIRDSKRKKYQQNGNN
jgi:adenylosuccinate synthase